MTTIDWSVDSSRRSIANTWRSVAAAPIALAFIVVVGIALRAGLLTVTHAWGGIAQYDDGVHLGAAQLLFAGRLPYKDFVFLQPPGILLLLQPLAALARLIGEDRTLVLARVMFVAIGACNICLVWKLLRRRGAVAATIAAAFYALWFGTASTERTIMLEPVLNLGLLVTLLLVRRGSARTVLLSGVVLGFTCAVKLWPLAFVAVIAVWLMRTQSVRLAARFVAGAATSFAVVIAPFWILAGRALPDQVVSAQLGRPRSVSFIERLQGFDGFAVHSRLQHFVPVPIVVLIALIIVFAALRFASRDKEAALWCGLLLIGGATLMFGSSFFYHYPAFVGVPLAAIVGMLGLAVWSRVRGRARPLAIVVASVLSIPLAVASAKGGYPPDSVRHQLPATVAGRCVWAYSPSLLITTDTFNEPRRCDITVDTLGLVLLEGQAKANRTFQAEFMHADAALLQGGPLAQRPDWTRETIRRFEQRFQVSAELPSRIFLWTLRTHR